MKQVIQHEKYGEITYEESSWTGRKSLSINGAPLEKVSKKEFRTQDGKTATIGGNFLIGATLLIEGESIRLTPKIKWYEIALCIIPFILILVWGNVAALVKIVPVVGGAIGGAISALMSVLSLFVMKSVKLTWQKVLIGVCFVAVTFGICCGIGLVILGAM